MDFTYWDYLDLSEREARTADLITSYEERIVVWYDGTDTEWTPKST